MSKLKLPSEPPKLDWSVKENSAPHLPDIFRHAPSYLSTSPNGRYLMLGHQYTLYQADTQNPAPGWRRKAIWLENLTGATPTSSGRYWVSTIHCALLLDDKNRGLHSILLPDSTPGVIWGDDDWVAILCKKDSSKKTELRFHDLNKQRHYSRRFSAREIVCDFWVSGDILCLLTMRNAKTLHLYHWLPEQDRLLHIDQKPTLFKKHLSAFDNELEWDRLGRHAHGWPLGKHERLINLAPCGVRINHAGRMEIIREQMIWHPFFLSPNITEKEREQAVHATLMALHSGVDPTSRFTEGNPFFITSVIDEHQVHVFTTLWQVSIDKKDIRPYVEGDNEVMVSFLLAHTQGPLPNDPYLADTLISALLEKTEVNQDLVRRNHLRLDSLLENVTPNLAGELKEKLESAPDDLVDALEDIIKIIDKDSTTRAFMNQLLESLLDDQDISSPFPAMLSIAFAAVGRFPARSKLSSRLLAALQPLDQALALIEDPDIVAWVLKKGTRLKLAPDTAAELIQRNLESSRTTGAARKYFNALRPDKVSSRLQQAMRDLFFHAINGENPEVAVAMMHDGYTPWPLTAHDPRLPALNELHGITAPDHQAHERIAAFIRRWLKTRPALRLDVLMAPLSTTSARSGGDRVLHALMALEAWFTRDKNQYAHFNTSPILLELTGMDGAQADDRLYIINQLWRHFQPDDTLLKGYLAAGLLVAAVKWKAINPSNPFPKSDVHRRQPGKSLAATLIEDKTDGKEHSLNELLVAIGALRNGPVKTRRLMRAIVKHPEKWGLNRDFIRRLQI